MKDCYVAVVIGSHHRTRTHRDTLEPGLASACCYWNGYRGSVQLGSRTHLDRPLAACSHTPQPGAGPGVVGVEHAVAAAAQQSPHYQHPIYDM